MGKLVGAELGGLELVDEEGGAVMGVAGGGEIVDGAGGAMYMCDAVELPVEMVGSLACACVACRDVAGVYTAFAEAGCARRKYVVRERSINTVWSGVGEGKACRVVRGVWRLIETFCGGVGDAARAVAGDVVSEQVDVGCSVEIMGALIDGFRGLSKEVIIGEGLRVVCFYESGMWLSSLVRWLCVAGVGVPCGRPETSPRGWAR